jgi:hypothetical protein
VGRELRCTVTSGGQSATGRALLETDELLFRGEFRLKIPFSQIQSLTAADGRLHVEWSGGSAVFDLGPDAEKWAEKIRNPKSLTDKLGVKPGMRVAVIGMDDDGFAADLATRAEVVASPDDVDMVFLGVESPEDMARLAGLKEQIKRDGVVWVVYRKGRKDFNENEVLRLGLESGMVDVKVVRFSDTHTATKFVIRKSDR